MSATQERAGELFDPTSQQFLADPYPELRSLREATPVLHHEGLGRAERCPNLEPAEEPRRIPAFVIWGRVDVAPGRQPRG